MPLRGLFAKAAELAAPVLRAAGTAVAPPVNRRVWSGRHRSHIEIRGVHRPGTESVARAVERRLLDVAGVRSAEVNAVLGRVVIGHDPGAVDVAVLASVIALAEAEYDLDGDEAAPRSATHPANAETVLRDAGALLLGTVGLGYATLGTLLPLRAVSPLVPTVVALVDSVPWLRGGLERTLGRAPADAALAIGSTAAHGLSQRPLGVLTDLAGRFCASRETIARHEAWHEWEAAAVTHRCDPVASAPRPRPLPGGPVENVATVSGGAALAGSGTVLAAARDPQRALALLQAGTPRPAKAGREAFSTYLTTAISERGGLVAEPDALRRLDRVDTIVFDAPILLHGRRVLDAVIPLDPAADTAGLFARAGELVDPADPDAARVHGEWSLAPLSATTSLPDAALHAAEAEIACGATVFTLHHRSVATALVTVIDELDPLAEALVETARANATAIAAGADGHLDRRLPLDRVVAGGADLANSVRQLQKDGAVVAVVATDARAALAAADVGIGLSGHDTPAWDADILCPTADVVHMVLSATENGRSASKYAAGISVAGSGLATLFAALGSYRGTSMSAHAATLAALLTGTWEGMRAAGRPAPVPLERTPWHAMSPAVVLSTLSSSEEGLSEHIAVSRRPLAVRGRAPLTVAGATVEGLISPITPVLGAGAAVSAGLGSVIDAVLIGGVLLASALVDGIQQVSTDREMTRLLEAGQLPARRRRAGTCELVPADQLVPGDVIELRAGDGVPADCRLLTAEALEADESSLTGESQLAGKDVAATTAPAVADRTCMLYQGTAVASGDATAVVVAVGAHTEIGRSAQGTVAESASGVEARLAELTRRVLPVSVGAGAGLFLVDVLRRVPMGQSVARSVGLAVAAVPEGLPFVATLAELAAARRLSRRGVLVRSPKTIEALGRVDALCFDKTGTLTQGRITLRQVSNGGIARSTDELDDLHREVVAAGVRATPRQHDEQPLAHLTDQAVLDGARAAGVSADGVVLAELPFEPSRGFHAVHTDGLLSVKGAPEVVLDRCTRRRHPDGSRAFDADARADIEAEVERLALRGYRLLAVAERAVGDDFTLTDPDVHGLEFVGLLGLADPVHPTAAESVGQLSRAGVDVIMITGDHPSTAEAIATELGMLGDKRVLTGAELDNLDDEQLAGELPKISVFARVSPAQKARIVRRLRAAGRIVAMTGDGANDVPAINLAQVGIAFGSRATAAARDAADLVVADDRIETLTDGIVEGRGMWSSVRDALSILLGGNLGEIGYAVGTGLINTAASLNARQLLVVNLLTDIMPAIAIATRPPPHATPETLLAEGPERSLGSALVRDVAARAAATAGAAGIAWMLARPVSTAAQARTTGLVALVCAQLAQTLTMRGTTPVVLVAALGSVLALAGLVQIPGVSQLFGNSPLLAHQWGIALGTSVVATLVVLVWQKWPARPV